MITYVSTSIFDSRAHALVNPVNCVGVMGKGLAAAFKARYPEMFTYYQWACRERKIEIGKPMYYGSYRKTIVLFPTKQSWRQSSNIGWIDQGLAGFVDSYWEENLGAVSFPKLGCGLGGLDWNDVKPVMEKYLQDLSIPVYIHTQ